MLLTTHAAIAVRKATKRETALRSAARKYNLPEDLDDFDSYRYSANMTCRNCNKVGHMAKECTEPRDM